MTELAIGLGAAAGGILATVILFFILLRASGARDDRSRAELATVRGEYKELFVENEHRRENEDILTRNQGELDKQIADLKTSNQSTEAELASVKASHDDLVRSLAEHAGALPSVIHDALERLRAQVSAPGPAAPAADPNRGEDRSVHGSDALERPE